MTLKKTRKPKGEKGKADVLFSKIVRRVGRCENCGSVNHLQCAHIISRMYSRTRVDEANAVCLCAGCHIYFTKEPIEWSNWVLARIGQDGYDAIRAQSQATTKVIWKDELARLQERARELGVS